MGKKTVEQHPDPGAAASSSDKARLPGDHEVVCISCKIEPEGFEQIVALGFRYGRKVYVVKADELVDEIRRGTRFHVTQGGRTSYLRLGVSAAGQPFVQTIPDDTEINNLSLLRDCAALERVDRQARAVVPLWWWLIPLALLALTAFFVIVHLVPISLKWDPVADITYPTPLGADQLNATANLSGEYIYEPAAGTVLQVAREQVLRVTFHTEPLPSPWRELAIVSGLLALGSALIIAFRAWRGWFVDRRLRQEEAHDMREVADAPAAVQERVARVEELWGDTDELPKRRPSLLWPTVGLALVVLALAGVLWYYLIYPRSALAQQSINVMLPCDPDLRWDPIPDVTCPFALTETQLNAVAAMPGKILYDPPLNTQFSAAGKHTIKATFTPDSSDCTDEVLTNTINVLKGTPTLTWIGPIKIEYGDELGEEHLNPEARVPGAFTFSMDVGATPRAGSYDLIADFHPQDSACWNDASISVNLLVAMVTPDLDWPPLAAITYPTRLGPDQLNAQAEVPGTFTYTKSTGTVLEVGDDHLLAVEFQPDDSTSYNSASAENSLTVLPGVPDLAWEEPADITVGTPLGPDQLNAQAYVPAYAQIDAGAELAGTYTYTPTTGTVLEAGDGHLLTVEFQPEDKNYTSVPMTVSINVRDDRCQPHQAQFLRNGDFEGGFTVTGPATAVGAYWRHFNNGDYHYGYYDDPWDKVWYNAEHSQLIEIGSATYDPGDRPNRLSGISQTVRGLIPGERYTLTLHGIIRASEGDPDTDNMSYVTQWGVSTGASATWEDVETWNAVPWTHVFPYLSAGPVQTYTTTFTAQSDTLTLFIGLLKKPGRGNTELNLNLDSLSLVGPTCDPHQAQFLKNGDFEGGFTVVAPATAVGTHWRHFSNGDYHYGYYDDPWDKVWYNAEHSQLIEIGSATYDPGDRPNRLSGISQTVRGLIPGERYTLTLHGIIRVGEGDPNTDNMSYVAQWGVATGASATWEDVETWNAVPWTHVFPYLSAGPVQTYTTTFTAQSDTLTLFIGLLKKPGEGNTELNLNLDGLSLVGPTYDPGLTLASK